MKNQYAGDLHDYRKLSLLRILAGKYDGKKVGVVWMKTADDPEPKDGNRRKYVKYPKYKLLDSKLFEKLRCYNSEYLKQPYRLCEHCGDDCSITQTQHRDTNIRDLENILNELNNGKFEFVDSINDISKLNNCDLIFFDPDNGISDNGSEKHLLLKNIEEYKNKDWLIVHFLKQRTNKNMRLEAVGKISRKFNRNVQAIKGGNVVYFYITNELKNIIRQPDKFFEDISIKKHSSNDKF